MDFIALRNELNTMRPQSRKNHRSHHKNKKHKSRRQQQDDGQDNDKDENDDDDNNNTDLLLDLDSPDERQGDNQQQQQEGAKDELEYHQAFGSPTLIDPTLRTGGLAAELRVDPEAKMKLRQKYDITKEEIGRGAYGRVVKATNRLTGGPIAIKIIDKNKISQRHLSELNCEVETLTLLHHKNVVALEDVYQDDKTMFICMEFVAGGSLSVTLKEQKRFAEAIVRQMGLHFLQAISHIHAKGIVHRDLKPANVLLTQQWIDPAERRRLQEEQKALEKENDDEARGTIVQSNFLSSSPSAAATATGNNNDQEGLNRVIGAVGRMTTYSSQGSNNGGGGGGSSTTRRQQHQQHQQQPHSKSGTSSNHGSSTNSFASGGGGGFSPYCSLKLADFGFAVMVGFDDCLTHYCGTTAYMAPEIIEKQQYGKSVDMWSFGVILFQLLSGDLPFSGSSSDGSLQQNIYEGNYSFTKNPSVFNAITPAAKDLISKLLVVDPAKRLTAKEAMGHVWIRAALMSPEELEASMILYSPTNSMRAIGSYALHKKKRTHKTRIKGLIICVLAVHRLVFITKVKQLNKSGAGDVPVLRSFSFLVHGVFEPETKAIIAGRPCYSNMAALRHLTTMIGASRTVKTYDVSSNGIDSMDLIQHIVKVSVGHPSLTTLNMSNNPIPPLAGRALIRLARSSLSLTTINVNNTNLGRDVIVQIGTDLKANERKRAETARPGPTTSFSGSPLMSPKAGSHGSPLLSNSISSNNPSFGSPVQFAQRFDATPFTKSLSQKRKAVGGGGDSSPQQQQQQSSPPTITTNATATASSSSPFRQHQQQSQQSNVQRRLEDELNVSNTSGADLAGPQEVRTIKTKTMTIFSNNANKEQQQQQQQQQSNNPQTQTTSATTTAKRQGSHDRKSGGEGGASQRKRTPPPVKVGVSSSSSSSLQHQHRYHSTVDELESYLGTSLSSLLQRPKNIDPATATTSSSNNNSEPASLSNTGTYHELPAQLDEDDDDVAKVAGGGVKSALLSANYLSASSSQQQQQQRQRSGNNNRSRQRSPQPQQQQQQQGVASSSTSTSSHRKGISRTMQQHQQYNTPTGNSSTNNVVAGSSGGGGSTTTKRSSSQNSRPINDGLTAISTTTTSSPGMLSPTIHGQQRRSVSSMDNFSFGSPDPSNQRTTGGSSNNSKLSLLPPTIAFGSPTGRTTTGGARSRSPSVTSPTHQQQQQGSSSVAQRNSSLSPPGRLPVNNNNSAGSPTLPPLGGGGHATSSFGNQRLRK